MPASDTVVIILAAGKGTRMRSATAKVLHQAGGRALLEHSIRACQALKPASILVVAGHQAEEVSALAERLGARTVLQNPQRGTGHAMQIARKAVPKSAKLALVVPGDAPLLRSATLAGLLEAHREGQAAASILSAELADAGEYGRILRDSEGRVSAIVEQKSATPEQLAIREVNSGIYCFTIGKLWPCLNALRPDNTHRELYLTDVMGMLRQRGERLLGQIAADENEILGCNTRAHLAAADRLLRARKAAELMDGGATMYLPETILSDPDVKIGQDTIIEPGAQLLGATRIGERCRIGTGCILRDMHIEDEAVVAPYSHLEASRVRAKAEVGPFSRLRAGADIGEGGRIGNFVEVKNTAVRDGAKALHLTYLGDASIGKHANIGAGTITCNYDGVSKNKTTIGARAFIGSDTALVAPVRVGEGAYVAAGSVVTENVPDEALAIARGRQVNKPGWARRRKAQIRAAGSKHRPASRRRARRSGRQRKPRARR